VFALSERDSNLFLHKKEKKSQGCHPSSFFCAFLRAPSDGGEKRRKKGRRGAGSTRDHILLVKKCCGIVSSLRLAQGEKQKREERTCTAPISNVTRCTCSSPWNLFVPSVDLGLDRALERKGGKKKKKKKEKRKTKQKWHRILIFPFSRGKCP